MKQRSGPLSWANLLKSISCVTALLSFLMDLEGGQRNAASTKEQVARCPIPDSSKLIFFVAWSVLAQSSLRCFDDMSVLFL